MSWKALITDAGNELSAKTISGGNIKLTHAKAGSGTVSEQDLHLQTELVNVKQTLSIESIKYSNAVNNIEILLDCRGLKEAYDLTQIGIYATDPDAGEILFAIAQTENPKHIPAENEVPFYSIDFNFAFALKNNQNMVATIDQSTFATKEQLSAVDARIDNIIVNAGSTEDNAELIDMRVDVDGKRHSTAGEALRSQLKQKANLTDISSPYQFRGACLSANLPGSGNKINDTYYVTDKKCKFTWNGAAWYQSSLNESDYEEELSSITEDLKDLIVEVEDIVWIPNSFIDYTTGNQIPHNSNAYAASDFIELSCSNIKFNLCMYKDNGGIAFYDVNKNFICGYSRKDGEKYNDIPYNNYIIEKVPIDAKYVRITEFYSKRQNNEEHIQKLYKFISLDIYNTIDDMHNLIHENEDNISEVIGIKIESDDDLIIKLEKYCTIKNGFYNNKSFVDTSTTSYGKKWFTIIIPVEENAKYSFMSRNSIENANHAFLDEDGNVIELIHIDTPSQFNNLKEITTPEKCKYFGLQYQGDMKKSFLSKSIYTYGGVINKVNEIDEKMSKVEIPKKNDYTPINLPYLFKVINNGLYSREYIPRVFPESFLDFIPSAPATVNYRRDAALDRQRKTTALFETVYKKVLLQVPDKIDKNLTIPLNCMNEKVFDNAKILLSIFGVSFDSIDYNNPTTGLPESGGSYLSNLIEKFMKMGQVDNNDNRKFVNIGTITYNKQLEYKENSYTIYGCCEARGGNNGINYLRQPINFSPSNIAYDPNVSGTYATGDVMWYMNGLRYRVPYNSSYSISGTDYGEFEKTVDKLKALRYTPLGKYHHDYSSVVWDFLCKTGYIQSAEGTIGQYVGSLEQKVIIDNAMKYLCENPTYPFYDIDKARETSYLSDGTPKPIDDNTQYAFNYSKMIERYRTMDDEGVRLVSSSQNPSGQSVIGSDGKTYKIGTKITSQNKLYKINVCKPTHVIWDMSYNDWCFYGTGDKGQSYGIDSLAMTKLFISAIMDQIGKDVKIGLKAKKENGAFFPEVWSDVALAQKYIPSGHLLNYNKLLIEEYSDLSQNINYIPAFQVSIPFASNFLQQQEDFTYEKCLVNSGESYSPTSDVTHEGLYSAKAMAYQIYGWLAYTVKDKS